MKRKRKQKGFPGARKANKDDNRIVIPAAMCSRNFPLSREANHKYRGHLLSINEYGEVEFDCATTNESIIFASLGEAKAHIDWIEGLLTHPQVTTRERALFIREVAEIKDPEFFCWVVETEKPLSGAVNVIEAHNSQPKPPNGLVMKCGSKKEIEAISRAILFVNDLGEFSYQRDDTTGCENFDAYKMTDEELSLLHE